MVYLPIHIRSVRDEGGSGERRGKITDRSELSVTSTRSVVRVTCVTGLVLVF